MHFNSNIKLMRKRRGRTQDEVAFTLNMKRSTLSGYENGVAQPGILQLIAYSEYFGISVDTLIKIDLSKLRESELRQLESGFDVYVKGSKLRILTTTVDSLNNENIELVPQKAKAGYMRGFADPEFVRNLPVFQLPFLSPERKYRTFQISGDSMLPIPDGAWITGEFIQDWNTIKNGEACIVLTLDEGIVFKVLENLITKEGKVKLSSLNPLYKPYELSVVEIREIWRFIHYISDELPSGEISPADLANTLNQLKQDVALIKERIITNEA